MHIDGLPGPIDRAGYLQAQLDEANELLIIAMCKLHGHVVHAGTVGPSSTTMRQLGPFERGSVPRVRPSALAVANAAPDVDCE